MNFAVVSHMKALLKLVAAHPEAFVASEIPCCLRALLETDVPVPRDWHREPELVNDARFRGILPGDRIRLRKALGRSTER